MTAHAVTRSGPITRRNWDVPVSVLVLRCAACPSWRAEVRDRVHADLAQAAHEAIS